MTLSPRRFPQPFAPHSTLDLEIGTIAAQLVHSFNTVASQHVDDVAERMGHSREYVAAHFKLEHELVIEQQDDRSFKASIRGQLVPR